MDNQSTKIAEICECIDHSFGFLVWCDDFARRVDPDDLAFGLARGHELISHATRLHSFLALRKLDDFLSSKTTKADDLVATKLGLDVSEILSGKCFLTSNERQDINKGVAHLTKRLSLDADSEVELKAIVVRSIPIYKRLILELCNLDTSNEAEYWLNKTGKLVQWYNEVLGVAG
ncbi:hypothetical protein SAMN04488118_11344 [Epibacterium ulvae]|uniref:HEPN AbiU2-like domain-containing protein n=1 Tax=Epibacterium ulvae TaxID=1156985 RepID=A0A1G5RCY5_9RHOB|nr:hypothetical protein [Epibacterium ulvae]SCZ71962.1 hypothetical protein SAMN04488118_11344 [Epibacterium ulvae]